MLGSLELGLAGHASGSVPPFPSSVWLRLRKTKLNSSFRNITIMTPMLMLVHLLNLSFGTNGDGLPILTNGHGH